MHRFRKKSETARGPLPSSLTLSDTVTEHINTPQLPLPNDFRTSLILPELSRRFSLLRSATGDPVGLDVLKNRLAEQRARGAENQISEEEEEMILNSLRFRSKPVAHSSSEGLTGSGAEDSSVRQSHQSTSTSDSSLTPSVSSSPTPRPTKRHSNNLFGSGKFRDYTYMRSVAKNGSARTHSLTPTESSQAYTSTTNSLRPVTPESSTFSSSAPSSPNDKASSVRSGPSVPASYGEQLVSVAEYRIAKTLGPAGVTRASTALEEAIREIEETEDEIVMPRSTPIPRTSSEHNLPPTEPARNSDASSQSSVFQAPMAIGFDKDVQNADITEQRASPVPARILPGYIPGMPRPMTPRDSDPDDLRSHSTTPRATSPISQSLGDISALPLPINNNSTRPRRDSASSQSAPRSPTAPLFLQRSTNGRFTPDDGKRPASPLSSPPYQPMTVSSRPGTPSNVVWAVPKVSQKLSNHNKNGSWASDGGLSSSDALGRHTPGLRSPGFPESPTTSSETANANPPEASPLERSNTWSGDRPSSRMSGIDLSSPMRGPRSPTPTQNPSRSPTSPSFPDLSTSAKSGKRSSKQNAPSNRFNLSPIPPLIFSPFSNASRSSLESEGSSYHTWEGEEKDRSLSLIIDLDVSKPVWHDLSISDKSSTPAGSEDDDWDPEEYISRHAGLKKSDFKAIHDKLVSAFIAKEERPERAASSLRRRRPSTSQSNYSVSGREHRIASPQVQGPSSPTTKSGPTSVAEKHSSSSETTEVIPPSPKTLRNRDLATALFGKEEGDQNGNSSEVRPNDFRTPDRAPKSSTPTPLTPEHTSPYRTLRNPSTPRIPQTPQEEAKMAQEVQQRMDAATLALKSPSTDSTDLYATISRNGTINRKRINPNQISNPRLVSASTSVDTVPIVPVPSVSSSGPSKIGSRFKKLRGTLRAKNALPTGEEITPYSVPYSPSPTQMVHHDPSKLKPTEVLLPSSATEPRFKVPVPSPPASAGPGLKGFMARLRGKPRVPDNSSQFEIHALTQPLPTSRVPASQLTPQVHSPSIRVTEAAPNGLGIHVQTASSSPESSSSAEADDTLKQLFEAAQKMGIDEAELNALLTRKGSTSSKTVFNKADSVVARRAATPVDNSRLTPVGRPSVDEQSLRAVTPEAGRSTPNNQISRERPASRQHSRKHPDHIRRPPREGQVDRAPSAIIRRTVIFPDSKMTANELVALVGKGSSGRRRGSLTSASSRSIHDRAPTPPPPRSPTSKRFSNGPSPPVPSLPSSLALPVPTIGAVEKSSSTYDSLFDMYAGESRSPSTIPQEPTESGAGVEVIQLANGETIWKIVNGLRDDEEESIYNGRASFTSEHSGEGGVQVFFKEHSRSGSKGSMASFVSGKKPGKRPETKVFYSPSTNIGRLIEEISQGMDSGSFNFLPSHSPSSSLSTNDTTWNLEERLDEMIQTVRAC